MKRAVCFSPGVFGGLFLMLLVPAAHGSVTLPPCRDEGALAAQHSIEAKTPVHLSDEVSLIYRALTRIEVVIEAGYDSRGHISCASPLSGKSLYWQAAIDLLIGENAKSSPTESRFIFAFDDPGFPVARRLSGDARIPESCHGANLSAALESGFRDLLTQKPREAAGCFSIATEIAPESVAAQYGAAVAAGLLGELMPRIEHYKAVVSLSPQFYEARIGLADAQRFAGQSNAAEANLVAMIAEAPPLPVQMRAYDELVSIYDASKRRRDAAIAKDSLVSTEIEIWRRHPSLVDQALLAFDTKNLAARQEEVGEYASAMKNFNEALRLADTPKISEAVRFEADLGRIRAAKRLGHGEDAGKGCDEWRKKLTKIGGELDDQHWGGKSVAQAQWEFSCGDFARGLRLLQTEMQRQPTKDGPYLALERAYRARGESELGDKAHSLAEKVRTAHDQAILGAILKEANELAQQGGIQRLP